MLPPFAGRDRLWPRAKGDVVVIGFGFVARVLGLIRMIDCRSRTVRLRETRKTLCRRRSRAVIESSRIASVGEEMWAGTQRNGRARKAMAEQSVRPIPPETALFHCLRDVQPTYTALHHRLAHTFPTRLCTGVPLSQRNVFTDNNRRFSTGPTGDERDPPGRRHMKVYCHCAGGSDDTFPPFICLCGGTHDRAGTPGPGSHGPCTLGKPSAV